MKIDRALIIRMKDNSTSVKYALECAKSCERHNLPYEYIDAIDKANYKDSVDAFAAVGVKPTKDYSASLGNSCCHASMIKCWNRIVEIGTPCLILEHDALVVGDVTSLDIPDMAVVTFGHRVSEKNQYRPVRPAEKLVEVSRAIGVHACGLSPVTAQWLVDDAKTNGIITGVDRYLIMQRKSGLPLYVCEPPQAVCWVRDSTIRPAAKKDLVNFPESLSKSWYDGLTSN